MFERFVAVGFADESASRLYELVPDIATALLRLENAAGERGR